MAAPGYAGKYTVAGGDCTKTGEDPPPVIPAWIKIGSNLAGDAISGHTEFSFPKGLAYTKTKFEYRSGAVSCNAASGTRFSHWGCDKHDIYLGMQVRYASGGKFAPPAQTNGLNWNNADQWYHSDGQNSMTNPLVFKNPPMTNSITLTEQHYVAGTPLRLTYGEANGASAHDNGGVTYLDVYVFGTVN